MTRAYHAEDLGVEDYRDPEPEPQFVDEDAHHTGPYPVVWCEGCDQNTAHADWWVDEDYPVRVGVACLTCRRINPHLSRGDARV